LTGSRRLWFLVPGDLDTPTGGYRYDRHILAGLRSMGWEVHYRRLEGAFPEPGAEGLDQAGRVIRAIPDGEAVVMDGLAYGAMPDLAADQGDRLNLIALVHHPLAAETGLSPERAAQLRGSETRALAQAQLVLVTSRHTAKLLDHYGVSPRRVRVVEPGTDPGAPAAPSRDGTLRLLCVGALIPRKGHDLLLRALAPLRGLDWRLTCAGSAARDPDHALSLARLRDDLGLSHQVGFTGALDDAALRQCYRESHLFVLATRFEGYGMVLAEALAHGLPIVSTAAGAVPDTVPPHAGLLVPPDDPAALAQALRRLMQDRGLRRRLAAGALAAGRRLTTWPQAARAFAAALEEACRG